MKNYGANKATEFSKKQKSILESVFAGDVELAQTKIDAYTEKHFNLLSIKYQKKANRDFVA